MIIWGSRAREKQISTGTFHCPSCRASSAYSHQRVSRYFTLYFIPLFPTDTLGEYVRCMRCAGQFKPLVLTMTAEQVEALVRPWPCANCSNRNPTAETHCLACGARKDYVPPPPQPSPHAPPEAESHIPQA
jgi:hypothetical protein